MAATAIRVQEIHCAGCENRIRTSLSALDGVQAVKPSAERNDVRISYDDSRIDEQRLRAALADLGFEPAA